MFCPGCGKEVRDQGSFCRACGARLYGDVSPRVMQEWHGNGAQQGPPHMQPLRGPVPRIPDYLGWSIAVLLLCFWPTAIAAIVNATRVNKRLALGDIAGAQEASRRAKMWCWISFGIAVILGLALGLASSSC